MFPPSEFGCYIGKLLVWVWHVLLTKWVITTSENKVEDYAWMSTAHLRSMGCRKLSPKWVGLFLIEEVKPNALKLCIQGQIYSVINVASLKPYISSADDQVSQPPTVKYDTDGNLKFEVKKLSMKEMMGFMSLSIIVIIWSSLV